MNIRRIHGFPAERLAGAWIYGHVCASDGCQYTAGIGSGALEGGVAVDGADAEDGESWVVGGEDYGEGVLCVVD